MHRWFTGFVVVACASASVVADRAPRQASSQPSVAAVREATAAGRFDEAWAMLDRLPGDMATLAAAVELALAPRTPLVAAQRLPFLADRTARLSLSSTESERRLIACAIVVRLSADAACTELLDAVTRGSQGTSLDRARLWVARRLMGEQPAALATGWEATTTGSSALEVAMWPELPSASRVRLIESLLTRQDPGMLISALATLQTIPGPEALAVWRRLSAAGGPTYPGARTQIAVGLARHGDAESVKALAPHLAQLPVSDRLVLAQGRAERKEPSGLAELVSLLNIGAEHEALRAAEIVATFGDASPIAPRVRIWVRDSSIALRERWLAVAARLGLGDTAEVVRHLTSEDEAVRLAAAVAVTTAAARRSRQPGR